MPSEAHVQYKFGEWLNKIIKVMQKEADPAELAREMAQKEVKLEQEAIRDPGTGVYNKSQIGVLLGREVTLARKYGWKMYVLFLDLDYFREVNNTEGHLKGDEVLKRLVNIMQDVTGKESLIGRYGGEEFVVGLSDMETEAVRESAFKLGLTIKKNLAQECHLKKPELTASIGLASLQEGENVSDLINRSDKLMYQAKNAGRNRIACQNGGQTEILLIE